MAALVRGAAALPAGKARTEIALLTADVAAAVARSKKRRLSDRTTDVVRRQTVGARLRRDTARRYAVAAAESGRSLNRFVVDALRAEYERTTGDECPDI